MNILILYFLTNMAVASMKKKERAQFIFDPEYYCGKNGCEPRVPRETPGYFLLLFFVYYLFLNGECTELTSLELNLD